MKPMRILSALLAFCMCLSIIPAPVFAEAFTDNEIEIVAEPAATTDSSDSAEPEDPVVPEDGTESEVSAPEAPVLELAVEETPGEVTLTWNSVDGAVKYLVYRAENEDQDYSLLNTTVENTITDYTNPGIVYFYYVIAVNESDLESSASNVVSTSWDLSAPTLKATNIASSGKIKLTWNKVEGAKKYEVYRATSKAGTYSLFYTATGTSLNHTSATAGNTYYYKIRSVDAAGNKSEFSNIVSRTCDLPQPKITVSNIASTGKIKISWEKIDGAAKYEVYRSTDNETWTLLKAVTGTSLTNTSTTAGTIYYYKVRAIHSNSSANSAYSTVVKRACDLPYPVVEVSNVASTGKIKISWEKIDGAAKYQVYRSTDNENWSLLITTTSTSVTNTSATAGTLYYYKVRAIHSNSSANSAYSAVVKRTCDLSRPVVEVSNIATTGKIKISWNKIDGAAKYEVYRATSKTGSYSLLITTTGTSITNSKETTPGKTYYYKVRAIHSNSSATSAYSTIVSRTCDCAQPVVKVSSASASAIKISWQSISGADGYTVYRATSQSGTYSKVTTITSTSYTDKNITPGKTYYYKVIANGESSAANSAASAIVSAKAVPGTPTLKTKVTSTKSSIKISWNAISDVSGYYVYRRASTSDSWTKIATVTSGTSYTDSSASGRYYYCVAAYNTVNGTKYAGEKSNVIRARTLAAPTNVTVEPDDYNLENIISWNSVTGATGYQIYYQVTEDGDWTLAKTVGNVTSYRHTIDHGYYYFYKVRAIYKYDGTTSYGSYGEGDTGMLHYYFPEISILMSDEDHLSANAAVIYIENHGLGPVRFYSSGAQWLVPEDSAYDRDIVLFDPDALNDGYLKEVSYVDIPAGSAVYLPVGVIGEPTWYVLGTYIMLNMYYDGMYYTTYSSRYDGFQYTIQN